MLRSGPAPVCARQAPTSGGEPRPPSAGADHGRAAGWGATCASQNNRKSWLLAAIDFGYRNSDAGDNGRIRPEQEAAANRGALITSRGSDTPSPKACSPPPPPPPPGTASPRPPERRPALTAPPPAGQAGAGLASPRSLLAPSTSRPSAPGPPPHHGDLLSGALQQALVNGLHLRLQVRRHLLSPPHRTTAAKAGTPGTGPGRPLCPGNPLPPRPRPAQRRRPPSRSAPRGILGGVVFPRHPPPRPSRQTAPIARGPGAGASPAPARAGGLALPRHGRPSRLLQGEAMPGAGGGISRLAGKAGWPPRLKPARPWRARPAGAARGRGGTPAWVKRKKISKLRESGNYGFKTNVSRLQKL